MAVVAAIKRFLPETVLWWGAALGLAAGMRLIEPHGGEWLFYRPAILNGFQNIPQVANPSYMATMLYPLALLPPLAGAVVFTALNLAAVWLACRLLNGRRWLVLFSFSMGWLLWYAQVDGLVALGAALGWWALRKNDRPEVIGLAVLLLGLKPQVGGPLAIYYLWQARSLRAVWPVGAMLAVSLAQFGWWPAAYLQRLLSPEMAYFTGQAANISLWPYGLLLWALPPLVEGQQRIVAILAATMLSSPYTAYYSVLALLVFPLPWWSYAVFSGQFFDPITASRAGLGSILVSAWLKKRRDEEVVIDGCQQTMVYGPSAGY